MQKIVMKSIKKIPVSNWDLNLKSGWVKPYRADKQHPTKVIVSINEK